MTWLTPERAIVKQEFAECYRSGILPSLQRCANVIAKYPVLKNRNPTTLKAKVNNEMQRRKKLSTF
jgi:hypothetical protein